MHDVASLLHRNIAYMASRLVRNIAICLIVLGVSPFTAPFSTFDLGTLSGHDHSHQPSADHTPGGAMLKASTDPNKAPVLASTAALAMPLFSIVASEAAVRVPRLSSRRILLQGLRV